MNRTTDLALPTIGADESYPPLVLTPRQDLAGYLISWAGRSIFFAITCISVLSILLIFAFVMYEAIPFFKQYSIVGFLAHTDWYPQSIPPRFGALALVIGSFYVTFTSLLFAIPVGILAAVFLSEMVGKSIRSIAKPIIEVLAAIPSVAYGFFAIKVLAPWMQRHLGLPTGANALNASLVLAIMAVPTITSVAEDAISAVGRDLREAAYSLGSTRFETTFKVVVPAAHTGIIAAVILGMMRAIGETMVVWMAAGNASQIPKPWWDLSQSIRTMTATIAGEMGETAKGSIHYHALFALGLLLLMITFGLNTLSDVLLSRNRKSTGRT